MAHEAWTWQLERVIASDPAQGKAIVTEVLAKLKDDQWPERAIFHVHLALEEALVNAIKHGNCLDCSKEVHCCVRLAEDRVWIRVCDEGPGFNPEHVPDCTNEDRLEVPSGRGIMLMRSFMSKVEYDPPGNCVVMEKHREDPQE